MVKLVHEVWEDPADNSISMFRRGAKNSRSLLSSQARLIRTFEAESVFEAFRTHNRLMGYGEWSPADGVPDTYYSEADAASNGEA